MTLAKTVELVATEALLCGLKGLPVVGPAVGFVEGVHNRWKQFNTENRIASLEKGWSHVEGFRQSPAYPTISEFFDKLTAAAPDIAGLNRIIDRLQALGTGGICVPLFENMFRNGCHWESLKTYPQRYGRVLNDQDQLDSSKITVLIMPDKPRVLELPPFMLASLLSGSTSPAPRLLDKGDVWALPAKRKDATGYSYCAAAGCTCSLPKVCAKDKCKCTLPRVCIRTKCTCSREKMCSKPKCNCSRPKVSLVAVKKQ